MKRAALFMAILAVFVLIIAGCGSGGGGGGSYGDLSMLKQIVSPTTPDTPPIFDNNTSAKVEKKTGLLAGDSRTGQLCDYANLAAQGHIKSATPYQVEIAKEIFTNYKNGGVAGDTSSGLLKRLPKLLEDKPEDATYWIGLNDISVFNYGIDRLLSNYAKIIDETVRLDENIKRIRILSILPATGKVVQFNGSLSEANRRIAILCEEKRGAGIPVEFIDILPNFWEKAKANNALPFLYMDDLHFSLYGNLLLMETLREMKVVEVSEPVDKAATVAVDTRLQL